MTILTGKKIIIYGTGRFQMDFETIFDLPVAAYLSEDKQLTRYNQKPVHFVDDFFPALQEMDSLAVIVCDFERDRILPLLAKKGFVHGHNSFYAEDLFETLDQLRIDFSTTPVALWGTGNACKEFLDYYSANWAEELDIRYYLDNDISKQGQEYRGKPIRHPSSSPPDELKRAFIIVTPSFYTDIKRQLEELGLVEFWHFAFWSFVLVRPSLMLKKVIHSTPRPGPECAYATSRLNVAMHGVYACICIPFMTLPLGNILVQSCEEIWHSAAAKIFRLSIVNHTYCFCKLPFCNEANKSKPVRNHYGSADIAPSDVLHTVEFAFDCTCNLHCESCRDTAIHAHAGKIHLQIADRLLSSPLVNAAEWCLCCGGGEVFAGKGIERLLFSESAPVRNGGIIQTNLQLFNEKNWQRVRKHFRSIHFVASMDGATPETFERIRRGAKFDVMIRNLGLLAALRKTGEIEKASINMVVQNKNYQEMPAMLELAESFDFDAVRFVQIMNWGSYSEQQYRNEITMFENDDIVMKPELKAVVDFIRSREYNIMAHFEWQT